MENPIYKIFLKNYNTTFVFCMKSEFKEEDNHICTNMYIYGDDTLVDVINKIKINMISYIEEFKEKEFENIGGYLSGKWDYYNNYRLKEYIYIHIFNKKNSCLKEDFIKKLRNINRIYNDDLEEEIILESLNYKKIENIRENENELVIGYFDKSITNFEYYISPDYMETLIDEQRLIETELNKPINNYKNGEELEDIIELKFNNVENDKFKEMNYITLPKYLKEEKTNIELKEIYENNNENRLKLRNSIDIIDFNSKIIKGINYLSLQISNYKLDSLEILFNNIELNEKCPFSMISYKKDRKKKKIYKMFKHNEIPFIEEHILQKIIKEKERKKEYLLFKIFYIKNKKISQNFIDIFIENNEYFTIIFKDIFNIQMEDIVDNINNVLNLLKFDIDEKTEINMEDLYYYNSNNQILINNSNNYISNEFKMILNYTELEREIPQELDEKFIYFIIHFNTVFDIELLKSHILYEGKLYEIENITDKEIKLKKKIVELKSDKILLSDEKNIKKMKIRINEINLYYKKSFNYESYNYIEKYLKNIVTFKKDTLTFGTFECGFSQPSKKESFEDFFHERKNIKFIKDNVDIIINKSKYTDIKYCENIKNKTNHKCYINLVFDSGIIYMKLINIYSFNELNNICNFFKKFIYYTDMYDMLYNLSSIDRLKLYEDMYINDKENNVVYNKYNNIYNLYNILRPQNINEYYLYTIYKQKYIETDIIDLVEYSGETYDAESASDDDDDDDEEEENMESEEEKEEEEDISIKKY